jgi:hypothetical protein
VLDWLNLQVVTMLAEIFMVRSEAKARVVEGVLPSSTSQFVPLSPRNQFIFKETDPKGAKALIEEQPSGSAWESSPLEQLR